MNIHKLARLTPFGREVLVQRVAAGAVSYTHLRAHETVLDLVCRLLLENIKYTGAHNYKSLHKDGYASH